MAKKSMVNRELKRARLAAKYAAKRAELKKATRNLELSPEERADAQLKHVTRDSFASSYQ